LNLGVDPMIDDDCQFYGARIVGYASKKIRSFHRSDEAGSDVKIRWGVCKPCATQKWDLLSH